MLDYTTLGMHDVGLYLIFGKERKMQLRELLGLELVNLMIGRVDLGALGKLSTKMVLIR